MARCHSLFHQLPSQDELGDMRVFQVIKLYLELYKMRSIPLVSCINYWLNLVPITIWMGCVYIMLYFIF